MRRIAQSIIPIIAAVAICAGCSKSADEYPIPHWVEKSTFRSYGHWECPSGYTTDYGRGDNSVYCVSDEENSALMERWFRTLKPTHDYSLDEVKALPR